MGQALYRQYRPKSLSEVVGQEHITSSLVNALKTGKTAHAYLFTGPRGVGKTSFARILAHELNGLPYTDDSMHLDIIEIDAASNRRIDEIRELRDKVHVAPSSAKYKVYIIDEVHMLTREAFNALLKTLEEPPAHVVFILATTDAHKLPETIVSRTQRFIFKPYPLDQVVGQLRVIAEKEGFKISDEALELVAAHGEGSFRDSISLLDQTRSQVDAKTEINADHVRNLTGVPTVEGITAIIDALNAADAAAVTRALSALRDQGFEAAQIAKQLGKRLRQQILDGQGASNSFKLMEKLLEVPVAHDPAGYLELICLSHALEGTLPPPVAVMTVAQQPAAAAAPRPTAPAKPLRVVAQADEPETEPEPTPKAKPVEDEVDTPEPGRHGEPLPEVDAAIWPTVISSLKRTHNTLYGIVRMATPVFFEDAVELHFTFAFHKRRLSEAKNQEILSNVIKKITGREMGIRCVLDSKEAPKPVQATKVNPDNPVSTVSNIFGGAEVL